MDNFTTLYKILKALEKAMDYDEFDVDTVSAERLKISENRLARLWEMLWREGYVDGVTVQYSAGGEVLLSLNNPRITLKGLEYLGENSLMQKAAKLAKGIKDTIPGL